ncbi:MAG: DUF2007 domain-containing protein [Granulosicoccus sp.]|nr:DUF2007 domain-containing protein [Granulosicoccus sp.]
MKRAYTAGTLVDATLVADWLDSNGVPCEIFHQNAVGALGELPVTPPEVWVRRDADLSLALRLVGEVVFVDEDGEQQCQQCGEESPRGFDICWQCQTALRS